MITARERVHKAFKAALARGAESYTIPHCVMYGNTAQDGHHIVCDEMTHAAEFDRTLIRNGHEEHKAEPTA